MVSLCNYSIFPVIFLYLSLAMLFPESREFYNKIVKKSKSKDKTEQGKGQRANRYIDISQPISDQLTPAHQ